MKFLARLILLTIPLLLCAALLLFAFPKIMARAKRSYRLRALAGKTIPPPPFNDPAIATKIGEITDKSLAEISGLTPSHTGKGLWWAHNDSGDQARLYVINAIGKRLATFNVTEASNRDWEDMASGPGADGQPALYLADAGNNTLTRDVLTLYRVKEPDLSKGATGGATEPAEAFPFRYPNGNHDAEALFVDPHSGRPYLITKKMTPPCAVYRFPLPLRAGKTVTLEPVTGAGAERIAQLMLVTGAAVAPDGKRLVVRTYFTALEFTRPAKAKDFAAIFDAAPVTVKLAPERQGEAISYTADGKALITVSENVPAPLYRLSHNSGAAPKAARK